MNDFTSNEIHPATGEEIRVDWDMEELLERWTDEPISWWVIRGIDDGGGNWEAVGQFIGDFAGNHYEELIEVEDAEWLGFESSKGTDVSSDIYAQDTWKVVKHNG